WLHDLEQTTINEQAGKTDNEWHLYFKEFSLLNIYIRNNTEGTADTMAALYEVKVNCGIDTYNNMRAFIIENISTTWASVDEFTDYLSSIERWSHSVGIVLRTDSDMYTRAMGIK
ncbi:MAG: hypothetical protein WC856_02705, partial [Methylococcaceae bacterium]